MPRSAPQWPMRLGLLRLGVQPGEKIALYLPNSPYHPYSFFAVLKAGGVGWRISRRSMRSVSWRISLKIAGRAR